MEHSSPPNSPTWGTNTKLIVGLTLIVLIGALIVSSQSVITPLLIALVVSYLFHPIAEFFQRKLGFSWGASVGVLYLIIIIILIGSLAIGGVGLAQQIQNLIINVQNAIQGLPELIQTASEQVFTIGPFAIDLRTLDLNGISEQILGIVQPLLNRTGSILGSVAGGAANFLGWTLFVLLVSYFVLAESGGLRERMVTIDIPGYAEDIARLTRELGRIWNAFLRGQIILFFLTIIVYAIALSVLGVNYALPLAFLAGVARFVPYVGPAINWGILVIVAYFQVFKLFGMEPWTYTLLVLIIAIIIDQIFDNIISPRILSDALKVHPAAVLVAAIIAANLFGFLGVVVAAPILATALLLWQYTMRKLLDLDPFPDKELHHPLPPPGSRLRVKIRRFFRDLNLRRKQ
ncbi:MAG: AI-2E family transporter [Anaerolineales bacterium]|nr:AI-2E family transporter [Anaerolineales bacterium]